ncbi:hypothetical protein ACIGO8_15045 [Streptomyces sp. NPDC053493]|uniref:hypothetical protein n=1 Tax=Streptomyces sp. NPDC053493 TaxID=3365705 RepID=UPI0037D177B5
MLRTRIAETAAVAVVALGALFLGTAATAATADSGSVVAEATATDAAPVTGTDNMTWQ